MGSFLENRCGGGGGVICCDLSEPGKLDLRTFQALMPGHK